MRQMNKPATGPRQMSKSATQKTSTSKKPESFSFDMSDIENLIALLRDSGINEIELAEGERSIRLRKDPTPVVQTMTQPTMAPVAQSEAPAAPSAEAPKAEATAPTEAAKPAGKILNAPMVGTFYSAPSPDADAFVSVGDKVKKGQILCIIEAMKTMNQIEAEFDGTITEVLIEDGTPVEYGEPLFTLS